MADLLRRAVDTEAQAPAASQEGGRLSYAQLAAEVDRYARALLARGLRRGDRLAMLAAPSVDFWIVFHAAASIGVTWLGVNPRYQARDFEHMLADSEPALLVVMSPFDGRDYCEELAAIAPGARMICHGEPSAGAVSREVFLAAGDAIDDATLAAARAAVDPEVCAAPVNHVGAINNLCMPILAAGGHIIFHPRVDVAAIGEISRREQPTYLVSSPTGFAMMLQQPVGMAERLKTTRLIVFGGAVTPEAVLEQFARPGLRLSNVYGQSETCGIITRTGEDATLKVMSETIGEVLPGAELRVADPATNLPCPPDQLGEIQVRGPYLMSGYFRNPEASAAAFTPDGFLRTGDLGVLREDGNVVFGGRLKEMFKSGGYNGYPVEVEQAICEPPAAAIAAVVAAPHPTYQEVGHAFVELAPGASVSADELRAFLRSRIANYKVPKSFTLAPELPRLPNGKVDKLALKAEALAAG